MAVITTHDLTKYYGKTRGIENVSITVQEGEIFGFIGPNGAGKSTTIRTLLGLIFPTRGTAEVFGKDCIRQGYRLRRRIGYLPSEVFYYDKMKVIDLLNYAASFYPVDCKKRILELSEIMELQLNRPIEDLSYGNKKKVGIVQGLCHSPDLIILDEPTSGLDPLMQKRFFNLIREENKRGATVFFSSHILQEVQHLCDRVAIIKDGSIIKIEDVQVLRRDNYKKVSILADDLKIKELAFDGVSDIREDEQGLHFFYRGDIGRILDLLRQKNILDLNLEPPSLEEIFMHYYDDEKSL